ncbi:MAG TPA: addiction module protein [Thermoanaerobaculia bacterium]
MGRTLSKEEIQEMPVPQRIELIGELWNSVIAAEDALPITDEHRRLLDESIEEYRQNPDAARPWDDVRREVFRSKKR